MSDKKTVIITGASGGIGAGLVEGFLKEGYNVVGTYLNASQSLNASPTLVLINGDIGKQETAANVVEATIHHFGTIDAPVNNAGIYRTKPFIDFTTDDFDALVSTNLLEYQCLCFDDYERGLEYCDAESRNRVRKRWYPLQRRSPGRL